MKFDKLTMFANRLTVPVTASTTTDSGIVDLRKCGEVGIDGQLRVWAGTVGSDITSGITTVLKTSDDGSTWTSLVSVPQSGSTLMACLLPCSGLKRYITLDFVVGETALAEAVSVVAGLVDQFDQDALPAIQSYPPLEDVAAAGDVVTA